MRPTMRYRGTVLILLLALPLILSMPAYQALRQQELNRDIRRTYGDITRMYDRTSSTAVDLERETQFARLYEPKQPMLAAVEGGDRGE